LKKRKHCDHFPIERRVHEGPLYTKELREIIKVWFRSKCSHCGNRGGRDIFSERHSAFSARTPQCLPRLQAAFNHQGFAEVKDSRKIQARMPKEKEMIRAFLLIIFLTSGSAALRHALDNDAVAEGIAANQNLQIARAEPEVERARASVVGSGLIANR
jgi:hypothetical protein